MRIVKKHRFNAQVTALELGYGIIGRPLMNVYCYLIGGTLIDCGQARMAEEMKSFASAHRINQLLLTHHHEDHSGNAAMIAKVCSAAVMGHPVTVHKMTHIRPILPYQHLVWGQSREVSVSPLPALVASDGFCFLPIHTPGHSKDHTVYLEMQNGWLFSGDLYLGERIKFFRSDEKIDQQIQSLKTMLQYDFEALFCGHNPILKNGRDRLRRKLAYLEEIAGQVRFLLARGLPEREIIRRLDRRQDRFVKLVTLGNASFANMVRSAIQAT
ncbi:MBL fold metallo-hydrolase [uncultured Desulfosarcina sp.]|uniref:MBL fold metallo-hydrolase n=1 Tax=uncultured Desulfosarcina sp. TaxID=218289 RepID=UPI0029C718E5|nr:MBL fold metallo-hydrolase [uncultured Desulfosarcina sp.]